MQATTSNIVPFVRRANGSRRKLPSEPGGKVIVGWFLPALPPRREQLLLTAPVHAVEAPWPKPNNRERFS